MPSLLRTHPPTEERVQRLLALRTTIDEVEPIRLTGGESLHSEGNGVLPKWHISRWWR
jgi:heat shock protein HtpX